MLPHRHAHTRVHPYACVLTCMCLHMLSHMHMHTLTHSRPSLLSGAPTPHWLFSKPFVPASRHPFERGLADEYSRCGTSSQPFKGPSPSAEAVIKDTQLDRGRCGAAGRRSQSAEGRLSSLPPPPRPRSPTRSQRVSQPPRCPPPKSPPRQRDDERGRAPPPHIPPVPVAGPPPHRSGPLPRGQPLIQEAGRPAHWLAWARAPAWGGRWVHPPALPPPPHPALLPLPPERL